MEASRRGEARTGGALHPRVVILARADQARVEVLELPADLAPGSRFRWNEDWWHITGVRSRSRVLFAEPAEA